MYAYAGMMKHSFTINSVIRGYHVYKDEWDAPIGEVLYCEREIGNRSDPCAVAVKRTTTSVVSGHVPRFMSEICSIFLRRGGTIECIVVGARKHSSDLPQGGLEVPCLLKFKTRDAKECSRTNMLLISSISEFPEGGSVQSSCTLCTGNSCAKPTDNNKFTDSSLSLCSDSMNATIYSHSTSMQSSATQTAISSEKVIEIF